MRQRFMDSIPWATLLVSVGVGTALAVTPRIAHADHKQSCYAGIVIVFDGAWHPGAQIGCRTVNVSGSNNVVGAEVNFMIAQGTIRPRVQAVVGSTSTGPSGINAARCCLVCSTTLATPIFCERTSASRSSA